MSGKSVLKRVDWLTVLFYLLLVTIGWVNIYSSTFSESDSSIFDFGTLHGKQLFFIGASLASIVILLALEANFYERFSSLMYLISMVLLLGLFVFGKTIAGATSWYNLGFFNLQPSELAKVATAMALAKYLSDIQMMSFFENNKTTIIIIFKYRKCTSWNKPCVIFSFSRRPLWW